MQSMSAAEVCCRYRCGRVISVMSVSRHGLQMQMRRKISSFRPNKRRRLLPQVPVAGRSAVHKDTYLEGPSCRDDRVPDGLFSGIPLFDRPIQMLFKSRRASQADDAFADQDAVPLKTEKDILLAHYVPVYVMLPLDSVTPSNVLSHPELLVCNLKALKAAGVDGVMVDVWWGIVEGDEPRNYDWSAYQALFRHIAAEEMKIQVVMSFHQCGGNTGDSCYILLPKWVLDVGNNCPDIFFTNRVGMRNQEYLSFGIDEEPVLRGRTGVQVYYDFMKSFRDNFEEFFEAGLVTEVEVGLGPAGELRYPSYPQTHGWRFPGIGEFQCYDNFLLEQLRFAAQERGQYQWGTSGPHDAGSYNDWPQATGFFCNQGSFATDYGRFFLEWYSGTLLQHGDRVLEAAADAFAGLPTKLAAKVAGVHWWYNSKNHAAELAAGYYNLREKDGYRPIAKMLARHYATLNFTCAEMRNHEQYWEARCGPEGLVQQVLNAGWQEDLEVSCENALPRYDVAAFDQVIFNARPDGFNPHGPPARRISTFTFLRLSPELLAEHHFAEFVRFVKRMHVGLDREPDVEKYFKPRTRLRRSKPRQAMRGPAVSQEAPHPPVASVPLDPTRLPLNPAPDSSFFTNDAPGGGLGTEVEQRGDVEGELAGRDEQGGSREQSNGEGRGEAEWQAERSFMRQQDMSQDREGSVSDRNGEEGEEIERDDRGGPRGGGRAGGGGGSGSSDSPVKQSLQYSESRSDDEILQAAIDGVNRKGITGQQGSGIQRKQQLVPQPQQQPQQHQQRFVSMRAAAVKVGASAMVLPVETSDSMGYGSSVMELLREIIKSVWLPLVAPWPQRKSGGESGRKTLG